MTASCVAASRRGTTARFEHLITRGPPAEASGPPDCINQAPTHCGQLNNSRVSVEAPPPRRVPIQMSGAADIQTCCQARAKPHHCSPDNVPGQAG